LKNVLEKIFPVCYRLEVIGNKHGVFRTPFFVYQSTGSKIMKCPKCNYISFDFNKACPSCDRDISAERDKMNLPHYRPSPPFLLGSVIADSYGFSGNARLASPDSLPSAEAHGEFDEPRDGMAEDMAYEDQIDLDIDLEELALEESAAHEKTALPGALHDEKEMVTTELDRKKAGQRGESAGAGPDQDLTIEI
jgi:hypothetical protein